MSISRKLRLAILAVVALFLLQMVGIYISSQRILDGLTDLYQQVQISDRIGEAHLITDTLSEVLVKPGTTLKDSERVFNAVADSAAAKLLQVQDAASKYEKFLPMITQIEVSLNALRASAEQYYQLAPSKESHRYLALSRQFALDVTEEEDQLRLSVQKSSIGRFTSVYRERFFPRTVGTTLTLIFAVFSFIAGTLLTRRLVESIESLIRVTQEVAKGNLDVRAPVLARDEMGMLANAFNQMTRDLQRSTYSREYVEAIIQSLPDSLFVLNQEGLIESANRTAARMTGFNSKDLIHRPIARLFRPGLPDLSHELRDFETTLVTRIEGFIPVSISSSATQRREGRVAGIVLVVKDLSERKELEAEKLRAEQAQWILSEAARVFSESIDLDTTLQHILQVVISKLGDCCFVRVIGKEDRPDMTKAFCDLPESEKLVRRWSDEVVRTQQSLLFGSLEGAGQKELKDLGVVSGVVCPLLVRGEALGTLTLLSTKVGHYYETRDLELLEEIARRAAIAIENSRLYHEAQEAILSRDEFLSIASHELRTPLTALSLQLQIFAREIARQMAAIETLSSGHEGAGEAFMNRALRIVTASEMQSRKLASLLDELLDLTRIRLGKLQLITEVVDLSEVVRNVVDQFKVELAQKAIPVNVHTPKSLEGNWDAMRVEQIVNNLISNALKYGNGSPITVTVELQAEAQRAKLVVSDRGLGIPPHMRDRIFERFERAGISGKKIAGLGLGLYIVRQIVEAHGGTIRVESEVGKGSSFIVELPLKQAGAKPAASEAKSA